MKVLEGAVNFTVDYAGGEVFYRYVIREENHAFQSFQISFVITLTV